MTDFSRFDTRRYRTLPVVEGYGEWAPTYEATVRDEMDVALLAGLRTVPWGELERAADLGCGSGRTGAWLRSAGVAVLDGVDLTPEMLRLAEAKGIYERLVPADLAGSGLVRGAYDLVAAVLVDEHLGDLAPLYREAARLVRRGGYVVVVGYHPQFIMASGMPTHFHRADGEPVAIQTHVHLLSDHADQALRAGWRLLEISERVIDDRWVALKPKWARHQGVPISFAMAWRA